MEHLRPDQFLTLTNPGVVSLQLLSPRNSASVRVTVTKVTVAPGAVQPRHAHATSEQIWYAISGSGQLLLSDGSEQPFNAGELVRFADGDIHGLQNTSAVSFEYISVTSPPIDFNYAYAGKGA